MATENLLMDAVRAGGDRQVLHEKIRRLSMEQGRRVKEEGLPNRLLEALSADPDFPLDEADIQKVMDPSLYTGCAAHQVERFLAEHVRPVLEANKESLCSGDEIKV